MENTQAILERMEKSSRQQLLATRLICVFCAVMLLCTVVLTVAVSSAAREISALAQPIQHVTAQVQDMVKQAETIMDNMEAVTQALADADLGSMVENVNILTAASQSAVAEAIEKLDAINIDTLNSAIEDLAAVVEPLANFSKLFG